MFEAGDTKYIRVATIFGASGGVVSDPPNTNSLTSVSRGSKTVEVPNWTGMTPPVAGNVISLVSGGVTDYYEVAASTATSVALTTQYRGTTSTVADIALEVSTGTEYWGISLDGVAPPFDVLRNRDYSVNRFIAKVMADGEIVPAVPVTNTAKAYAGVGVWQQVAMDEFLSWGFLGAGRELIGTPPGSRPSTTVEGGAYSTISLVESTSIPGMTSVANTAMTHLIYVENTTAGGGTVDAQGSTLATIFGVSLT